MTLPTMENQPAAQPAPQPINPSAASVSAQPQVPAAPAAAPLTMPAAATSPTPSPIPAPLSPTPAPAALNAAPVTATSSPASTPGTPSPSSKAGTPAVIPATPAKPGVKAPLLPGKDQSGKNRKLIIGCISAFGCSLLLFIGVLFAFLAFGGSTENPIFRFFGVPQSEVIGVLITLVHLIFLVLVFIAFIFVVIGIFKITTARKDDKDGKRKAAMFTFGSLAILVVLIFSWVLAYFFLQTKQPTASRAAVTTTPEITTNLTAPVAIKFDGSRAVNTRQYEILSYTWDFGDGTTLSGETQTHTFKEIGNFKVKLTATVKERATGKETDLVFTKDVTIQNAKAAVEIKATPEKGPIPLVVSFDGSKSSSPNGELREFAWDLDGDQEFDDGTEQTAGFTYDKIGSYSVKLRVKDSSDEYTVGEVTIETTEPETPLAVIEVKDVTGSDLELGTSYFFSGAESRSPTGAVEKYSWDFGDSEKANTRTTNHTFEKAGEYDVTLTITDAKKKVGSTTKHFIVSPPQSGPRVSVVTTPAAQNGVITGQAPFVVAFDASPSTDPNDDIVEYSWDFDGDNDADDTNPVTSYTFTTAGSYKVKLTLTDATDLTATTQLIVNVDAAGLTADIKAVPVAGSVPLTVAFDGTGSRYPNSSIVSYEWDFGDGTEPRLDEGKVTYQYTRVGTFTAKVTAITADNKRASAQVPITVRPIPLKACFEPSLETGSAPLEVQFDPTCSTGTVVRYNWNFANLATSTERKPRYTFKDPGEYTITLEVADSANVVDRVTKKITVNAQ